MKKEVLETVLRVLLASWVKQGLETFLFLAGLRITTEVILRYLLKGWLLPHLNLGHPTHPAHLRRSPTTSAQKAHLVTLLRPHHPILLLLGQQHINLLLLEHANNNITSIEHLPRHGGILISKVSKPPKLVHIDHHLLLMFL